MLRGFTRQIGIPAAGGCPDRAFQKPFPFHANSLRHAGFVGRKSGSIVESPGSIVDSVGSIVVFPGSFVANCRRKRSISGQMSRNLRHHECLCRGIRDNRRPDVAEDATTRAQLSRNTRQPGRRAAESGLSGRAGSGAGPGAISIRDG
ncbi:MAG: hypothetical protein KDG49_01560, partial [Geminicoccaceae bacterium]|nr:hypothetical protein [Geminicoccaceae bacterium]